MIIFYGNTAVRNFEKFLKISNFQKIAKFHKFKNFKDLQKNRIFLSNFYRRPQK